ncbi:acyl carrier protein [Streptomyces sp. NPDC001514]
MVTNYDRLADLLVEVFEVTPDEIAPEVSLAELGIDSLGVEELRVNIHSRYGLLLSDGDGSTQATVADVCRLMDTATPAPSARP